jgi:hypothetical protein
MRTARITASGHHALLLAAILGLPLAGIHTVRRAALNHPLRT